MASYGYDGFTQKEDNRVAYRALSEPPLEPETLFPVAASWHEAPAQYNCDNFYDVKQSGTSCNYPEIGYYTDNYQQSVDVQLTEGHMPQDFAIGSVSGQNYVQTDQQADSQFVLITTGNCIDCDKIVDFSKDDHPLSECILLKPFECKICGERFNFRGNMDVHEVECHIFTTDFTSGTSCSFCTLSQKKTKVFSRFHAYKSHLKGHYKPDVFNCTLCSEEFEHEALYQRHRRLNHRSNNDCEISSYSSEVGYCPKCRRLIRTQELAAHKITHQIHQSIDRKRKVIEQKATTIQQKTAKNKPHQCNICSKSFRRPVELRRHVAVHEDSKRWACSLCDKKFVHESGLLSHKKSAHSSNAKQFSCKICKAVFTKMSNVDRHVKQNHPLDTTKYLFDCELCSVQLQTRRSMQRHVRMYHMEGSLDRGIHQCGQCFRNFPRNYNLQRHLLSCTFRLTNEELQNRCNRCGKGFKFRASLIRHMEIHTRRDVADPTLTDPKCPICMKHISSKSNLAKHLLTHQANYECPDCFQRFTTLHRLDRHRCVPLDEEMQQRRHLLLSTQSMDLPKLDESFSSLVAVDHTKPPGYIGPPINPLKSYFCKQCPSSFFSFKAFKEHRNLHLGIRPHICWICHKSFRTQDLLGLHKQFHSRENVFCEYCPEVLPGRVQYSHHIKSVHQSTVDESSTLIANFSLKQSQARTDGAMSTQSCTEDVGRQLAESLFQARALSANPDQPLRNYIILENGQNWKAQNVTVEAVQDRAVRCDVCFHQYDSIASLVEHWSSAESSHAFEKIRCPLCSVTLRGAKEATSHMMYVHPYLDQPITTGVGEHITNESPETFETHRNDIQKQKNHPCTYCDVSFSKNSDLVRHIRRHTGEKPFICQICNRGFSVKSTLNAHVKTHDRSDPELNCPLCPKTYFTKSALVLHLRVHSGAKPLRCRFCSQAFSTSNKREAHEKTIHHNTRTKESLANSVQLTQVVTDKNPTEQNNDDLLEMLMNEELTTQLVDYSEQKAIRLNGSAEKGYTTDVRRNVLFPVKRLVPTMQQDSNLVATMRQISRVKTTTIQQAHGSAFAAQSAPVVERKPLDIVAYIYVTARRLSEAEYSVVVSRNPPKAIRVGIDETFTIKQSDMDSWAANDIKLHLSLPQDQKLSLSVKGVLSSLASDNSVTLRARKVDPLHPRCVELVEEESEEIFCKSCDICEMEFTSKVMSDAHFASDDHEAAQFMHPPPQFEGVGTIPATSLHPRKEASLNDYNCKLCGRKFLDMEPLIAHIRRDHERDHQQQPIPNYAARPAGAARTAPPAPVPQLGDNGMS